MYGDIQGVPGPFSSFVQQLTNTGRLVTAVRETNHIVSAASPTSTLQLAFKSSEGNPYDIGSVSGSVLVNADASTTLTVTVSDPNFYIKKMGGVTSGSRLAPDILDPQASSALVVYEGTASSPSTVSRPTAFPVIGFDSNGNFFTCSAHSTPSAACAGPWYSYHFVEICPKNKFATKAPTAATLPIALGTPAPTSTSPLIDVVFTATSTPTAIVTAFENARDLWNDIIVNTHSDDALPAGTTSADQIGDCDPTSVFPSGTTSIDGITIFATIGTIDGPGGVLGRAGPCAFSYSGSTPSSFGQMMPRAGQMIFDSEDLQPMVDDGSLERVILHEMGHVLGLGTLWNQFRIGSAGDVNNDPRYVGVNGIAGYRQIGGLRSNIPLANTGSTGTANAHWRESTFEDELMTGYASGAMPVSAMTVKSLEDLGYTVDESKAEGYSILAAQQNALKAGGVAEGKTFGDDILHFGGDNKVMSIPLN
jgi:hypothetical protein